MSKFSSFTYPFYTLQKIGIISGDKGTTSITLFSKIMTKFIHGISVSSICRASPPPNSFGRILFYAVSF